MSDLFTYQAIGNTTLFHVLLVLVGLLSFTGCDAPSSSLATSTPAVVVAQVTPAAGKGALTGLLLDYQSKKPVSNNVLYLGEALKSTTGDYELASLDPVGSPRAYSDEGGRFAFNDLVPKEYLLAAGTPTGQIFLINPDSGKEIRVVAHADQVEDIGTIYIDFSAFK